VIEPLVPDPLGAQHHTEGCVAVMPIDVKGSWPDCPDVVDAAIGITALRVVCHRPPARKVRSILDTRSAPNPECVGPNVSR
jgi:hypothetical protein